MVGRRPSRRDLLLLAAAASFLPKTAKAGDVVDLDWQDLLPKGQRIVPQALRALIDHDGPDLSRQQPEMTGIRDDWNGQIVRLPGFIVPLEHRGTGVTVFILAPFVGACIHVPPPPANQLVFVSSEIPYESKSLYEPVHVTGLFSTSSMSTHLAQIAYSLTADRVVPFA